MVSYLSVCSGIEAASVAWKPLGWEAVAFAEVEPFPCSVLAHHYPNTPNWGDMTQWRNWPYEAVDVLVGGTPCQSFSVAGKRGGMDDARGQLACSFSAIAAKFKPRWIVWENVPGVLSSGGGRDFGSFLGSLAELGYGVCYRVLDAQHFGVAQRRRRVFVVGHLGDWRRAAAVLFERESVQRDSAKGGKARKGIAGTLSSRTTAGGGLGTDFELAGKIQLVVGSLDTECGGGKLTHQPAVNGHIVLMDQGGSVINTLTDGTVGTLRREMHGHEPCVLAFAQNQIGEVRTGEVFNTINTNSNASGRNTAMVAFSSNMSEPDCQTDGTTPTLKLGGHGGSNPPAVVAAMQVRRLTPTECERLQGFPDGYTQVQHRGKPAADGPRYKALGNSMAVPVMAWIGRRIQMVEEQA